MPEKKTTKTSSKCVTVSWRGKTREYSEEVHGKDFKKLAESFAKKVDGEIS